MNKKLYHQNIIRRLFMRRSIPPDIVSLQCKKNAEWKTLIGPDSTFSATGPQVDSLGDPVAHNYIPNSEGVGGAVGVTPTGWVVTSSTNIVVSIVNRYSDGSVEVSFVGTAGASAEYPTIQPSLSIAASPDQTWTLSADVALTGTLESGVSLNLELSRRNSADGSISSVLVPTVPSGVASGTNPALTAYVRPKFLLSVLAGKSVNITIRISKPQLSKSAVKLTYVPTYGSAAFAPSITDKGLLGSGAWTQMLQNSIFAGAASGTPGTAPTNWSYALAGGSSFVSGSSIRLTAAIGQRMFLQQSISVLASTKYFFSSDVYLPSTLEVGSLIWVTSAPAGSVVSWEVDGVAVASATMISAGNHKITCILTVSTTPGTALVRLGAGVGGAVVIAHDATFSNPQVSANYQYPYAASGPGQTVTVPASSATTGGNGTNTALDARMLEALRGKTDGVELVSGVWKPPTNASITVANGVVSLLNTPSSQSIDCPNSGLALNDRVLVRYTVSGLTEGAVSVIVFGGSNVAGAGTSRSANGNYTEEVVLSVTGASTSNTSRLACTGETTANVSNISVQRLLPSQFTAVALVYVGAGSGETISNAGILSCYSDQFSLLYMPQDQAAKTFDRTTSAWAGVSTWNRDEIHLKCVQTNAAGTQFRVGNRRYTSAMVPIDALTWGNWAAYDGSMNPLTHLRLALNGTIPLWFRLVSLSNKSLTDSQILNQVRYVR